MRARWGRKPPMRPPPALPHDAHGEPGGMTCPDRESPVPDLVRESIAVSPGCSGEHAPKWMPACVPGYLPLRNFLLSDHKDPPGAIGVRVKRSHNTGHFKTRRSQGAKVTRRVLLPAPYS
ncbi:hypothetical protein NDU88_001637 [Pleurodeles waltl]|uniref:Uncharacterized protein n=1 Tax=Pleurodeles waltl TaxID=8319 RepID=A0AAV7VAZ0_PLEWA|nr:hypothetical protein NDU88_001637 [Pleurodeles waltl]